MKRIEMSEKARNLPLQGCIQAGFAGKITSFVTKEAIGKAKVTEKVTKSITFLEKNTKKLRKIDLLLFSSNSWKN